MSYVQHLTSYWWSFFGLEPTALFIRTFFILHALSDIRCPTNFPFIFISLLLYSSIVFLIFIPSIPFPVVQHSINISFFYLSFLLFLSVVCLFCLFCVLVSYVQRPPNSFYYFVALLGFVQNLCLPFRYLLLSKCEIFILYLRPLKSNAQYPNICAIIFVLPISTCLSNCLFPCLIVLIIYHINTMLVTRLPITFYIPFSRLLFQFCKSHVCKVRLYIR